MWEKDKRESKTITVHKYIITVSYHILKSLKAAFHDCSATSHYVQDVSCTTVNIFTTVQSLAVTVTVISTSLAVD